MAAICCGLKRTDIDQAGGQRPGRRDVSGEIGAHPDTPYGSWRNIWASLGFVNTKYWAMLWTIQEKLGI